MFVDGPGDALLGLTVLLQSPGQLFWYILAFPQPSWFCCVLFFFLNLLGTSSRPAGCGTEDILAGALSLVFPASCLLACLFYLISLWPGLALHYYLGKEKNPLSFPLSFWITCEFQLPKALWRGHVSAHCGGLPAAAWVLCSLLQAQMGKEPGEGRARKPWESRISGMAS